MTDPKKDPGLKIEQIVLANCEFRHRPDFLAIPTQPMPDSAVEITIQSAAHPTGKSAIVSVAVKSKEDDPNAFYHYAVEILAIISAEEGRENMPPSTYVQQVGAALLFPFLRETVANLTMRGRFGPVWLKPFNVRAAIAQGTPVDSIKEISSTDRKNRGKTGKPKGREHR